VKPVRWAAWLGVIGLGLGAPLAFIAAARAAGFDGFPLDDAFIHQTYARNLALTGAWTYVADVPTAGSTSPLWTLLMAIGQALAIELPWWPMALGIGLSLLAAWHGALWSERALGLPRLGAAALFFGEWHLVWAAVSGMEIPLFIAWLAACWWLLARFDSKQDAGWRDVLAMSLLASAGHWIRPEAILALPFLALGVAVARGSRAQRVSRAMTVLALPLLSLLLYFAFNRSLGGGMWPNTFYAKQVEYGVLREGGLLQRAGGQVAAILAGPLAVLAFGIPLAAWGAVRERRWVALVPLAWAATHLAAYTVRLPVAYQHGRYLMPVIPVALAYGAAGLCTAWRRLRQRRMARVVLLSAWASAAVVALGFLVLGGRAYVRDVGLIDEEMVTAARWVAANTPVDSVIAAHDIGALGYYGGRRIVDLGGLTDAGALRVLRDTGELAGFLTQAGSDYLMTFPGLYPQVGRQCQPVFSTGGVLSPALGGENMSVYRWGGDCAARMTP